MRRQLVAGAAAVTATLLVAFVVPLGLAVRVLAANRPITAAEQIAQSIATVVALTDDREVIAQTVAAAQAQTEAVLTVFLRNGSVVGAQSQRTERIDEAFRGAAFAEDVGDATVLVVPATRADGTVAVVQAAVPRAVTERGVRRSWLVLAGLALVLFLLAVAIADWLGRTVVRPVRDVADTARRLAGGDLSARAVPSGPPEVADVAGALNGLGSRITALLAAEREMVADLSHRLRTPLTALRIDAEGVRDEQERDRLRADVDAVESTVTELTREARRPTQRASTQTVNLAAVVRDRAAYWGALADDQGREWAVTVDTDPVDVALDRAEAEALLDVLLDNVFTHTPEGTGYLISLSPGYLAVEDGGPGLGTDQPTERGRSAGGSTGLGLDIARQTAGRLGGELRVLRREPTGTRVEVRLGPSAAPR
jgi:signal transduction histidine kinase